MPRSPLRRIPSVRRKHPTEEDSRTEAALGVFHQHAPSAPPAAADLLRQATNRFFWDEWRYRVAKEYTVAEMRTVLKKLQRGCQKILETIEAPKAGSLDGLGPGLIELLEKNGLAYEELATWRDLTRQALVSCTLARDKLKGQKSLRHEEPINELISRLAKAYRMCGKHPRLSRSRDQLPTGPFFRLVKAYIEALEHKLQSEEALFCRIRDVLAQPTSPTLP
jgi:hypothetical protein